MSDDPRQAVERLIDGAIRGFSGVKGPCRCGQDYCGYCAISKELEAALAAARAEGRAEGLRVRPAVRDFALEMERKLARHDNRPGWEHEEGRWLLSRLMDEAVELSDALRKGDIATIVDEAADVANFAMMIADNAGLRAARRLAEGGRDGE